MIFFVFCAFCAFFVFFFVLCFVLFLCLLVLVLAVGTYASMKFCDLGFRCAQGLEFKVWDGCQVASTALRLQEHCDFPTWPI